MSARPRKRGRRGGGGQQEVVQPSITREELQAKTVAELRAMAAEIELDVKTLKKKDEIVERVCDAVWGGMGIIFLHSAHFSKPFKRLMGSPCNLTWREAGERERLWVTSRNHPIAAGLPDHFELEHEEDELQGWLKRYRASHH